MELLGRDRERAALSELLDGSRRGHGGALVLRGELGCGLTALLDCTAAAAAAGEMRVVHACGVPAEQSLPFAAVHQLCASLRDELEALGSPQRKALAEAFEPGGGVVPDRFAVGQAVIELLRTAAGEHALLCVIDDLQWLDDASAETVAFVARRLARERVALVGAWHGEPGSTLGGIAEIHVGALPLDAAHDLLGAVATEPLDSAVRDRIVRETSGIPLGLVDVPAQLTPEQLAGVAGLPAILPAGARTRERLMPLVDELPADTRTLLLLAAIAAGGDASLLWAAAARCEIGSDAAAPAEARDVLRLGQRVAFRHPPRRLAIYAAASAAERRAAHNAFAGAIDSAVDPDGHIWHRAAASLVPDEDVARELEASAVRARSRRDDLGGIARLERAAELTADPGRRYGRLLAAAQAALAAGALGRAAVLVDGGRPEDEFQRAQAERLRGIIGSARGQGTDRATTLLGAARAFESLDPGLARDTYLEAIEAAVSVGRFGHGTSPVHIAEAARARRRELAGDPQPADMLLDGLSMLIAVGHGVAVPGIRRANQALRDGDDVRWLGLGLLAALETWDDDAVHDLATRVDRRRLADTVQAPHSLEWLVRLDELLAGRLDSDSSSVGAADVMAAAWRGRSTEARALAEECMRQAFVRDLGIQAAAAQHALAVLEIGLGRYEAGLAAARDACDGSSLFVVTATLPDLIEAAVRCGEREVASAAVARLAERTIPAGTHWALGTLTRSRALVVEGPDAERLYEDAIEHLRRSRVAPGLARAHLVYGEWLRRERRRREAREELRTARDMFVFMGAQAFAERARVELAATGEHAVHRNRPTPEVLLTAQEAHIARLARDGASNAEIAAELFISARTVEYHLHKVFRKLDVSSRTQLARVLPESDPAAGLGSEPR
jgi:DNA-binding CsgD family transcriptional regulator